jgi:hypothetical protein
MKRKPNCDIQRVGYIEQVCSWTVVLYQRIKPVTPYVTLFVRFFGIHAFPLHYIPGQHLAVLPPNLFIAKRDSDTCGAQVAVVFALTPKDPDVTRLGEGRAFI